MALNNNKRKINKVRSIAFVLIFAVLVSIMFSLITNAENLIFKNDKIRSIYTGKEYIIPQNAVGKGSVLSGIDLSNHNGDVDFKAVKKAGTDFVFLRAICRGYGQGTIIYDTKFEEYYYQAKSVGLKIGVYCFSQALNEAEAIEEAELTVKRLESKQIDLPVVMDYEWNGIYDGGRLWTAQLSKQAMTNNALAFINRVKELGYQPAVYASASFLLYNLDYKQVESVAKIWLAHYLNDNQDRTYYPGRVDYWQYSEQGTVPGINRKTDLNFGFLESNDTVGNSSNGSNVGNLNFNNSNKIPLYRMYNPNSGEHFYTKDVNEKNFLISEGWHYEGIAWMAPVKSKIPVYRLYNPNAGDHHYTTNIKERNNLINLGWRYENISFYASDSTGSPIYRQYNPNAKSGAHNFTKDKYENDNLVKNGWIYEGIAWYAL
ncbi:MAG: GH25 family lysozyme [Candidatus Fimenecus sp.]